MCIRDRVQAQARRAVREREDRHQRRVEVWAAGLGQDDRQRCLLYTSDAADERSSVDLGGRRILKKKKQITKKKK